MIVKQPDEKFATAPEGSFAAVCVDEIDLGKIKSTWSGEERERNMVRLVWQIDEEQDSGADVGKPFLVKQDYTASLDEKAKLRKHLQAWRGRAFTPQELLGFDLENVVGHGCMVSIVHAQGRKGGTFANVEGVMKLPKGAVAPKVRDYVRIKDRKVAEPASPPRRKLVEEQPPDYFNQGDDDSVPF